MPKTRSSARINGRSTAPDPSASTAAAGPAASGSGASSARAAPAPLASTSRAQGAHAARRSSAVVVAAGGGGAAAAGPRRKGQARAADPSGGGARAAAAEGGDRASAGTSTKRIKRSDSSTPSPAPSSSDGGAGDGSGTPLPVKADDDDLDGGAGGSLSPNARTPALAPPPALPTDHFTLLSSELISLVMAHLAAVPAAAAPDTKPDLHSLAMVALTCKRLLPHARVALYRDLRVETRVQAHAVHRTLHGSDISKSVRSVTANVESMAKTSSQWIGASPASLSLFALCLSRSRRC